MLKEIIPTLVSLIIFFISAYFSNSSTFAKVIFHALTVTNIILIILAFIGMMINPKAVKDKGLFVLNTSIVVLAFICGYFGYTPYSIFYVAYIFLFNGVYVTIRDLK